MRRQLSGFRVRFDDEALQDQLKTALASFHISHDVDDEGYICYSMDDHSRVERRMEEVLDSRFAVWRKFRCRSAKVDECRDYLLKRKIDFVQERWNNVVFFAVSVDTAVPPEFTGAQS